MDYDSLFLELLLGTYRSGSTPRLISSVLVCFYMCSEGSILLATATISLAFEMGSLRGLFPAVPDSGSAPIGSVLNFLLCQLVHPFLAQLRVVF